MPVLARIVSLGCLAALLLPLDVLAQSTSAKASSRARLPAAKPNLTPTPSPKPSLEVAQQTLATLLKAARRAQVDKRRYSEYARDAIAKTESTQDVTFYGCDMRLERHIFTGTISVHGLMQSTSSKEQVDVRLYNLNLGDIDTTKPMAISSVLQVHFKAPIKYRFVERFKCTTRASASAPPRPCEEEYRIEETEPDTLELIFETESERAAVEAAFVAVAPLCAGQQKPLE